jgi:molybdopterin/thiamine biosynthesis adenylyltransferase
VTERYARHGLIPGWDQTRLGGARVAVMGMGALGSEVAYQLARSGVGELILCDGDTVTESNLSRGALYLDKPVGRPKAEAAAECLAELNPHVRVDPRPQWLVSGVGISELRDATLVIGCLDSRAARVQLAMRCGLAGAALIDGGTHSWGGEVRYYPVGGPCYACGLSPSERAARDPAMSCADVRPVMSGSSAAVAALLASWLAVTALRLLFGLQVRPGTLRVEATGETYRIPLVQKADCPLHEPIPQPAVEATTLTCDASVAELSALLHSDETALTWAEFRRDGADWPHSIQLRHADPTVSLRGLGVAPREILRVIPLAAGRQPRYVELSGRLRRRIGDR